MEQAILEILALLRSGVTPTPEQVEAILRRASRAQAAAGRGQGGPAAGGRIAKKHLLPFYFEQKAKDSALFRSWGMDPQLEGGLIAALRMKPRRTASGVATITVLTKPWPCGGSCIFCPNDIRMPKSYLSDEPACQRAERSHFQPYLQVARRLTTLMQMGHVTDKVELIVLGGTWTDYPRPYREWFVAEMLRALNDAGLPEAPGSALAEGIRLREQAALAAGLPATREEAIERTAGLQARVSAGELSYNEAVMRLEAERAGRADGEESASEAARFPFSPEGTGLEQVRELQRANEEGLHRVVGLSLETRPDCIEPAALEHMRALGCTKVQIGIQSLDEGILARNGRPIGRERIARAFRLLRAYGYKVHVHFMANLLGSDPERDRADFAALVRGRAFQPDEVKLYPCSLIDGTPLMRAYRSGQWRPYEAGELTALLADCVELTPPFTRISRMIRDISAHDIVAGNRRVNLRQDVERLLADRGSEPSEIRLREIACEGVDASDLRLQEIAYRTVGTEERFLQWVDGRGRIAGFLRLSLPNRDAAPCDVSEFREKGEKGKPGAGDPEESAAPTGPYDAMIREVHVYGAVAGIGKADAARSTQHLGLGRSLVERACRIAREAGYRRLHVISAIGTRAYYRRLGFADSPLYQTREL